MTSWSSGLPVAVDGGGPSTETARPFLKINWKNLRKEINQTRTHSLFCCMMVCISCLVNTEFSAFSM
jgi:hypothetical protein